MYSHPRAKTTVAIRKAIRECTLSAKKAAKKFNVHENTIYKWRNRAEDDLMDRTNATKVVSFTLNEFERHIVCEMKKITLFSLDDLLQVLLPFIPQLTRKILYTTLKQNHLNRNEYIVPKEEKANKKRFKEYNEGYIHVDIKFLPKIAGERKYLFVAIDRRTRLVFAKIYNDKTKESSADFLDKLIEYFPFKINKVLTDNGKEFTDRFSKKDGKPSGNHIFDKICSLNNIEHRLTKPYTPQTNGMVERFNRRIQENVLDKFRFNDLQALEKTVNKYIHQYNFYIKQKKLDYKSPISFMEKEMPELYQKFINQHNQRELYTNFCYFRWYRDNINNFIICFFSKSETLSLLFLNRIF